MTVDPKFLLERLVVHILELAVYVNVIEKEPKLHQKHVVHL